MSITQQDRPLQINKSPLGKDELLLEAIHGREGLSELFSYHLDILSENREIPPRDIVGKPITFSILQADGSRRYFNGAVRRFSRGPASANTGLHTYRAEVVPWLWFLTRSSNCRLFNEQSTEEILKKVFEGLGFSHDVKFELSSEYSKREYCVQYRESDFAFVSRLMEQEGMFYYFLHESSKHVLVIADASTAYKECPEKTIEYTPGDSAKDHIHMWDHYYEFRSGKWSLNDYNFETPTNKLNAESKTLHGMDNESKYSLYDYPGGYTNSEGGNALARIRMEEEEVPGNTVTGEGSCRTLHPAGKFMLHSKSTAPQDHNKQFVITSIEHTASDGSFAHGESGGMTYTNRFSCLPADVVYRPACITPRPSVQGLESAVVVGPDKDTVNTDKYGRIKVKFHWDREDKSESCWIRTAQNWAGSGWGALFLPRVGQEVVISFLGGDPDRPIITGGIYNAQQMPPYKLPDEASQHGFKSRSWPNGESDMFNELRFDDKKGEEGVYFQAQKDFSRYVKHDDSLKIDNDRTIVIKKNLTSTIEEGDESQTLKDGNRSVTLNKGNDDLNLSSGNRTVSLKNGNHTLSLDNGKATTEALQGIDLKVAGNSIKISDSGITLTVGGNSIKISEAGVTVKGILVKLQADAEMQVKGAMTQVSGEGMLTLKGGIIMIN